MPRVTSADILPDDPAIKYHASWHPRLDPNQQGILWHLVSKVKNFIFYLPISLVAAAVNPRRECWPDYGDLIRTPDGVILGVRVEASEKKDLPANPKYVVIFNPVATNAPGLGESDFVNLLNERGLSIIRFNYRGLGSTWSPRDLIIDGDTVYQYLVNHHKIPPENIHFYGHSLGGAVAALVKDLHPESTGKFVGDRTLRSLFHVVSDFLTLSGLGPIVQKVTFIFSRVITAFIAYPLYWLGLDLNAERALHSMKGEKRVFYLSQDSIMRGFSGLQHASLSKEEKILITEGEHFPPISYQSVSKISAADIAAGFLAAESLPVKKEI